METIVPTEKRKVKFRNLKLLYDFQITSLVETANWLTKVVTIYLTIIAALIVYFISTPLHANLKRFAIGIAIMISIFAFAAAAVTIYGLINGVKNVRDTLKHNDPKLYDELNMDSYFKRGVNAVKIAFAVAAITLAIFIFGFLLM